MIGCRCGLSKVNVPQKLNNTIEVNHTLGKTGTEARSMSSQSKLRQSRARWKSKAGARAHENRYLRKELTCIKQERDRFKQEAKEAKGQFQPRAPQDLRPTVISLPITPILDSARFSNLYLFR